MSILRQIFETLREYYAADPDYPRWSQNPIEVILTAVLVQGSTWRSIDKVLGEFRAKELLDFHKIIQLTDEELAEIIRPVGFQTKKAHRIRAVAGLILERTGGDLDRYFVRDADLIRQELLSISGIGHGTADNILLYAGQVPIYMVDPFTVRVLMRHGIVGLQANEAQIQELIHQELTPDEEPYGAKLFQKMQEFFVRLGRDFCDKSRPDCFHCPLNSYLPEGGALGRAAKPASLKGTTPAPPKEGNYSTLPKEGNYSTHPKERNYSAPPKEGNYSTLPKEGNNSPPVEGRHFAQQNGGVVSPEARIHNTSGQTQKPTELPPDLNETERKIFEAIGNEPTPIDTVVLTVQLPVHIVRATIAILQMKKLVCQVEGNQVQRG